MNTAIFTNFLLWALLIFSCPDHGWATKAQEMSSLEVKMTYLMDRMTRRKAEMVAKDQRITSVETDMETKDQRIACGHVGDVCEDNGDCCSDYCYMWWCTE